MGDRRPKIQYQQLPLAFMTEGRGETPEADREGTESPTAKRGPENPVTGESLRTGAVSFQSTQVATGWRARRWSFSWIIAIWMNASLVSGRYS